MDLKNFKEIYLRWSKGVVVGISALLIGVMFCDQQFDFGLSENLYVIAFISISIILALLSLTWISALNLQTRFWYHDKQNMFDDNHDATLYDVADCVKNEGYVPTIDQNTNTVLFKIQGEPYRIKYIDNRFCIYKSYIVKEDTNIEALKRAILPTEEQVFGMKVFYQEYDDDNRGILFQFSSLIGSSSELSKHFSRCLHILINGVEFHRERYAEYLKTSKKDQSDTVCCLTEVSKVLS